VPIEFISRALAPFYDVRLDLRASSRLLVIGDLRVPRVVIRYEALGNAARLTIDAIPQTTSSVTQDAARLSIKFDADALDAPLPNISGQGLVPLIQAIRFADPVTVAIDLGPRFSAFRASTQALDANTTRLVIDIVAVQPETAVPPPPAAPPDLPVFGSSGATIRTVVIDPGHGGEDQGVKGGDGTLEKELTLAVARRARAVLESRLGIRVLLTRDDDRRVALEERTAVANNNKADLFVSLHANGSLRNTTNGASIYVAAFSDGDRMQASLAPVRVPIFGGGLRDIEIVPWDLAQIRHVDQSAELARMIERELENHIPLDERPIDRAPFRVLESANMPAVLVEIGYLTNAQQERQLGTAEFQNAFVMALSDAVAHFRDFLSGTVGDR
jgi:N-acetylmuramoyl-L-alanine amidase